MSYDPQWHINEVKRQTDALKDRAQKHMQERLAGQEFEKKALMCTIGFVVGTVFGIVITKLFI